MQCAGVNTSRLSIRLWCGLHALDTGALDAAYTNEVVQEASIKSLDQLKCVKPTHHTHPHTRTAQQRPRMARLRGCGDRGWSAMVVQERVRDGGSG